MAGRSFSMPLALAALLLLLCAPPPSLAQPAAGSLSGKLTDMYSRPLQGATVIVRNRDTGAEARTTTARDGGYRITGLGPGDYILEAVSTRLGHGTLEGIAIVAGHESRVQAALALEPSAPALPVVAVAVPPAVSERREAAVAAPNPPPATPPQPASQPSPQPAPHLDFAQPSIEPELALASPSPIGPSQPLAALPLDRELSAPGSIKALVDIAVLTGRAALEGAMRDALVASARRAADDSLAPAAIVSSAELEALPFPQTDGQMMLLDVAASAAAEESADTPPVRTAVPQVSLSMDGVSLQLAFGATGPGRQHTREGLLLAPASGAASLREVRAAGPEESGSGQSMGAHTSIESMRGGNAFHGKASLFTRQNLWDALNPFTQWVRETAPATSMTVPGFTAAPFTPGDLETSWTLAAGGPLPLASHRRGEFWFASIDRSRRNDPGISTVKHPDSFFAQPTNDSMQVLAARMELNPADPVSAGIAAYSTTLETLSGLLGPAPRTAARWTGFGRFDAELSRGSRFTLEGGAAGRQSPGGGLARAAETYGTHSYGATHTSEEWLMGRWQAVVSPSVLAVTQAAVSRRDLATAPVVPSAFEQSLNINAWGRLPQITIDPRYGFTIGNPARFSPGSYPDEQAYLLRQQFAAPRGHWLLYAGIDLSHNSDVTSFLRNQTGTYSYASAANFASDVLAFAGYGIGGQLSPADPHNCDATGRAWRDSEGTLHGVGYLPCYTSYSQTMGPTNWWLRTNDLAGYSTAQWQASKRLLLSFAIRWQHEDAPPPLAKLDNPDLPLTERLPALGNDWAPRVSFAWATAGRYAPVLHLGYGIFYGRTPNATFLAALTETGSAKGDLRYFLRPTDNLAAGGAPPFPYVFAGEPGIAVKPSAVEFAPGFRNAEVHQAVASLEQQLPGHVHIEASALVSLGRRLPIDTDANIDPAQNPGTITYAVVDGNRSGPLKSSQVTVPFFASWPSLSSPTGFAGRLNPNYQQVDEIAGRANSTYEAGMLRLTRETRAGLSFRAHYTFAHEADWNPDDSVSISGPSMLDPSSLRQEYGAGDLDVRHSADVVALWQPRWRLSEAPGRLANGWTLSGIGRFHSGFPYTMRTAGALAREFDANGVPITGLATGMNGYGGDNRVYGVGRNTYRYPGAWKADLRLARRFNLGEMRKLELLAQSFNLFNHQNVTELETVGYSIESGTSAGELPTLNFLTGLKSGQTEFGKPLNVNATDDDHPRQIEFGVRLQF